MPGIGIRIGPSRQRGKSAAIFVGMVLSGSGNQAEGTATGTAIGTLSVVGGTGTYTFTKTADPDSAFTLTAGVLKNAIVFDYETGASHSVTLHADNGAGSTFDLTVGVAVTDVAAPVLSAPTGTKTGSSTATLGVTTDSGNGTLYAVATTSATNPTAAQVKAGQDHTGAAAAFAGNAAIASSGAKTINATGLTASTAYFAHFMHEGLPAEQSAVVASASFTTDAPAVPVNSTRPSFTGTAQDGQSTAGANGTWTNVPTSYTYQYYYAVLDVDHAAVLDGGGLPIIDTAVGGSSTAINYTYVTADVGNRLILGVIAHNAAGASVEAISDAGGLVAAASFTSPADLTNLTAWYKADAGLSLSGSNVTAWADQSGNGHTNSPLGSNAGYNATGFNGHPCVQFGGGEALKAAMNLGGSALTVYLALYISSSTGAFPRVFSYSQVGGSAADYAVTGSVLLNRNNVSDLLDLQTVGDTAGAEGAYTSDTPMTLFTVQDGSTNKIYVGNVLAGTGSPSGGTILSSGEMTLAAYNNSGSLLSPLVGRLAEVVIQKGAGTLTDRNNMQSYFAAKYGI